MNRIIKLKSVAYLLLDHIKSFLGSIKYVWVNEPVCWDICITTFSDRDGNEILKRREEYVKKVKDLLK